VVSSHGYQALRQIAGRVVPAATTRRPSAAPSPSQHRLGELLLVWNGYDDNSALCSVRKPDRHTSDGFQTCSGGLVSDEEKYRIKFYRPGPLGGEAHCRC